jgi:hypothetical protein
VLVSLINPYGPGAIAYALSLLARFRSSSPHRPHVAEFQSPLLHLDSLQGACLVALLALSSIAIAGLWRERRFAPILLTLIAVALALRMSRNVPLLGVVALPGTAWGLRALLASAGAGARRWTIAAGRAGVALVGLAALLLALRVGTDAYYVAADRNDRFGLGWNRLRLPVDAAAFARTAGLEGNVLNHIGFGGYLMWALDRPVFIDGRLELAGDAAFAAFLETFRSPEALEATARKHQAGWVIFPYFVRLDLLRRLSTDPRWRLAYHDHLAAIFVRAGAPAATGDTAPDHALLRAPPGPLPGLGGAPLPSRLGCFLDGFVHRRRFSVEANGDGIFHLARGETAVARALFERTISRAGGCDAAPYQNLASSLILENRLAEALVPLGVARRLGAGGAVRDLEERIRAAIR